MESAGGYHTQQWNGEADGDEDVRISTQRLVRFRLCPTSECSMESAGGCSSGYGDYLIGMEEYLEAYFESVEQDQEYNCEYEKEYGDCLCEDTCSQFADEYGGRATYEQLTYGKTLPYSESTMIGSECMSCKESADADQNNDNDEQDADEVKESCEQLYEASGKCEAGLSSYIQNPNNNGCNFMEGIKIVRKNGVVVRGPGSKNTTASVFIGLFAASFVLLGGYAYHLKTKLDRAKVNLVSEE